MQSTATMTARIDAQRPAQACKLAAAVSHAARQDGCVVESSAIPSLVDASRSFRACRMTFQAVLRNRFDHQRSDQTRRSDSDAHTAAIRDRGRSNCTCSSLAERSTHRNHMELRTNTTSGRTGITPQPRQSRSGRCGADGRSKPILSNPALHAASHAAHRLHCCATCQSDPRRLCPSAQRRGDTAQQEGHNTAREERSRECKDSPAGTRTGKPTV